MKNSILKLVVGLYLLVMGQMALADTLGLYAGAGSWSQDYSGDIFLLSTDDFDLSGDNGNTLFLKFEHPIPVVPNIGVANTGISDSSTVEILGGSFATKLDLSHTDITFYYELIDTGIDLDLGLTLRKFDGKLEQTLAGVPFVTNTDISATIPMIYISARGDLPFTGFYLGADVHALSISGNGFVDYTAKIGWTTDAWILPEIGVEAGLRSFSLDADTDELDLDLDFEVEGVFINLVAHF